MWVACKKCKSYCTFRRIKADNLTAIGASSLIKVQYPPRQANTKWSFRHPDGVPPPEPFPPVITPPAPAPPAPAPPAPVPPAAPQPVPTLVPQLPESPSPISCSISLPTKLPAHTNPPGPTPATRLVSQRKGVRMPSTTASQESYTLRITPTAMLQIPTKRDNPPAPPPPITHSHSAPWTTA